MTSSAPKLMPRATCSVTYDSLETGSGYVSPALVLEFGARSTGDPLLYRSTNFVGSNRAPAKRCGKIGADPVLRQAGADARPSCAQQILISSAFRKVAATTIENLILAERAATWP